MHRLQKHFAGTLALAAGLSGPAIGSLGCANLAIFEAQESAPLPATISGIRREIGEQRELLLDLVSKADGENGVGEQRKEKANQMAAISQRLTALLAALAELKPGSGAR
jgi:hypothetical protein